MSKRKTVEHSRTCPSGKRRFDNERLAEKAMGRSQTMRKRRLEGETGSLRGLKVERRPYYCEMCDGVHLTHQNKKRQVVTEHDFGIDTSNVIPMFPVARAA